MVFLFIAVFVAGFLSYTLNEITQRRALKVNLDKLKKAGVFKDIVTLK